MKYDNQLRYAKNIIAQYDGRVPLAAWLKEFFRENRQMGSTDRKTVSELVYSYYRFGHHPFPDEEARLKAAISLFPSLSKLKAYFNLHDEIPVYPEKIFPLYDELSRGIDHHSFARSFLVQPDLFLRIRPGKRERVLQQLTQENIVFRECGDNCIAVANSTKIDQLLRINEEVVIQDKSSQQTGELLKQASKLLPRNPDIWDCCAASGGKSIMAWDILENIKLTVSDKRESIMHNLKRRFLQAGIHEYNSFVADLTDDKTPIRSNAYDLVIADVPCSGSGTWARTPEQLYFFSANRVDEYMKLQKKITRRVAGSLRKGGMLLYITCSVFRKENEEVVTAMEEWGLQKISQEILTGYDEKADTLFAALLINSAA